ncbi:hypothetical protein BS47DRAFT_217663 [Hydnum rufescens UP504]|uniref:V-SNARE coiled-coil homology domain-containing protein n=1 Tax=Hydnum rufescens UP504 TaxID=1448309 RepID=A0A9P6ANH0_9AGAM|nr:hypothetical protein BS47DRAFT_217663 [Hydnum rufescens UP504]
MVPATARKIVLRSWLRPRTQPLVPVFAIPTLIYDPLHVYSACLNHTTPTSPAMIDTTVDIMKSNINKVAERGERIDDLQDKTETLAVSAQGFRRGANKVRKNMWWKDMKMRLIIGFGIFACSPLYILPDLAPSCACSFFCSAPPCEYVSSSIYLVSSPATTSHIIFSERRHECGRSVQDNTVSVFQTCHPRGGMGIWIACNDIKVHTPTHEKVERKRIMAGFTPELFV